MPTNPNKQNAIQDNDHNRALIAHSGTAGTATTIRLVADSSGALFVGGTVIATSAKQDDIITELQPLGVLYSGSKTVPTGTAETIASSQAIKTVAIKALSTNTVAVYIGASGALTTTGFELLAGESLTLDVSNLNLVYCISGSASQVIRYIAV